MSFDEDNFQYEHSDKVSVLIRMLNAAIETDPSVKTIIFVKDRSVAVYLKKLLGGSEKRKEGEAGG